jgi:hypothetical protein
MQSIVISLQIMREKKDKSGQANDYFAVNVQVRWVIIQLLQE